MSVYNAEKDNRINENVNIIHEESSSLIKEFNKWEDLEELDSNLLRGIYAYGFDNPSMIQQKSILSLFDRKDIIAQAQSGTGKTGAFSVGVLQNIDTSVKKVQAIILAPTRELAKQIHDVVSGLAVFMKAFKIQLLVGGTS